MRAFYAQRWKCRRRSTSRLVPITGQHAAKHGGGRRCWLQSNAPTEYKLMPPPAIARWRRRPGPGYSGKPPDIRQTNVIREWPGRRLPISKILLFKIYSCAAVERCQGSGIAPGSVQKCQIEAQKIQTSEWPTILPRRRWLAAN